MTSISRRIAKSFKAATKAIRNLFRKKKCSAVALVAPEEQLAISTPSPVIVANWLLGSGDDLAIEGTLFSAPFEEKCLPELHRTLSCEDLITCFFESTIIVTATEGLAAINEDDCKENEEVFAVGTFKFLLREYLRTHPINIALIKEIDREVSQKGRGVRQSSRAWMHLCRGDFEALDSKMPWVFGLACNN